MNSKSKGAMLAMMSMALMAENYGYDYPKDEPIEIQPRPPKGAKEYFFNERGEFSTEQMLKSETVFICYAINDKNAIRKFERWQHENEQITN